MCNSQYQNFQRSLVHKMLRKLEDTFYLISKKGRRLGLLTGKPMKNTSARCESFSYLSSIFIYFFVKKNYNIITKDFTVGIKIRYYVIIFCNWMKCNNTSLEKINIFKNIQILCVGLLVSHSLQFVKQRVT